MVMTGYILELYIIFMGDIEAGENRSKDWLNRYNLELEKTNLL